MIVHIGKHLQNIWLQENSNMDLVPQNTTHDAREKTTQTRDEEEEEEEEEKEEEEETEEEED